jgi:hypothetical protein
MADPEKRHSKKKSVDGSPASEKISKTAVSEIKEPIIIQVIPLKSNQPKIANIIAGIAAAVSLGLGIITLFLFLQTRKQAQSSQDAATIARETLDSAKSYQKEAVKIHASEMIKADTEDAKRFRRDTATFALQKKTLERQIDGLKETQKEFETSHSPYVRIEAYKMMPQNTLAVTVENQGAAIAWLLENEVKVKADILYKPQKTADEWRKRLPIPRTPWTFQTLIAPGHNIEFRIPLDSISDADIQDVKNGKKYLYIRTVIYYFNTTNRKYMSMEDISVFDAKLSGTGTIWFGYKKLKKYPL